MAPVINKPMTAFEWSLVVGLSILWGGSFFFVAVALRELPPFTIVSLRVGLAAGPVAEVIHRARRSVYLFTGFAILLGAKPVPGR